MSSVCSMGHHFNVFTFLMDRKSFPTISLYKRSEPFRRADLFLIITKNCTLIIALTLLSLSQYTNAQASRENTYNFSGGLFFGNNLGTDLTLNYVFKNEFTATLGYNDLARESQDASMDPGNQIVKLFTFGLGGKWDHMETLSLRVGKLVRFSKDGKSRLLLSTGPGLSWIRTNHYAYDPVADDNTWVEDHTRTMSLLVDSKLEFPIVKYIGLRVGPTVLVNRERTFWGIETGVVVGRLFR